MDNEKNLTMISKYNKSFIMGKPKTAEEVVDFLEHGAMYRNFSYLVSELYEGEDVSVSVRLRKGFCEITGETDEKIRRNVQNWMNGKSLPQKRETLFQICFILGLDEEKSNRLLGTLSENRIHYRNPSELAYAFALRTGKSYQEAVSLKEEALRIYDEERALHRDEIHITGNVLYTGQNKELFERVNSEEDFFNFIHQISIYLGMQHETAYAKFMELLNLLQNPDEQKYSMKQVVDDYFRMNVPQTTRVGKMTALQKLIKKCWPSETTLDKMKTRDIDVNRKTMILLYLLTEQFDVEVVDDEEYFYCDEEYTPDELFEIRCSQMDLFLKNYGMNTLDYGNPFDLIVLYALHPSIYEQEEDFAAERIENVLEILYDAVSVEVN